MFFPVLQLDCTLPPCHLRTNNTHTYYTRTNQNKGTLISNSVHKRNVFNDRWPFVLKSLFFDLLWSCRFVFFLKAAMILCSCKIWVPPISCWKYFFYHSEQADCRWRIGSHKGQYAWQQVGPGLLKWLKGFPEERAGVPSSGQGWKQRLSRPKSSFLLHIVWNVSKWDFTGPA